MSRSAHTLSESPETESRARRHGRRRLLLCYFAIVLAHIVIVSPLALLTVLLDGLTALVVVIPPILAGLWCLPLFGVRHWPIRWQLLLGAACGLGGLSLLVLALGLSGVLHRPIWIALLILMAAVGSLRLHALVEQWRSSRIEDAPSRGSGRRFSYLWLLTAPFLSASLLAAANAPGLIWSEEGFGYDALEYHLQMPKEYFENGCITYAPYNLYANFPSNMEMLYLLGMIVRGDPIEAGITANFIHLAFAVLLVYATWVIGTLFSRRVATVAAVSIGTVGWLPYLSGLAYVESGLLFFGTVSMAVVLGVSTRAQNGAQSPERESAWDEARGSGMLGTLAVPLLSGVAAGFACGCKYTGVPMIAAPLALGWLLMPRSASNRLSSVLVCVIGCSLTFAPWCIKNLAHTGNPIFPLAHATFETFPEGWGPNEASRWERGHRLIIPADRNDEGGRAARNHATAVETAGARLDYLWKHLAGDPLQRFGPSVLLLGILGLLARRATRADVFLLLFAISQLAVWLFATHVYARFAVVLLVPLGVLTGRSVVGDRTRFRPSAVAIVLVAGAVWNLCFVLQLQARESVPGLTPEAIADGELPGYEFLGAVNNELDANAHLLLVGDARAFYLRRRVAYTTVFNADPFVDAVHAADTPDAIVDWLRRRGYTHVLVNWLEARRLRATYGFSDSITPSLFESLARAGLRLVASFSHPGVDGRYVELYELSVDVTGRGGG